MPIGPGKYDELCTIVRQETRADAAIVIVIGGTHGDGFSMQAPAAHALRLPALLRLVADDIEKSLRAGRI